MNTHPFDLKFVTFCPKFSVDSYVEFQEKTILELFFRNFVQSKANFHINLWNFALHSEILFWVRIALKKFRQVLSNVVCTQVRRHVHKQITKRRYGGQKPGGFDFGKPVLFTLGLGITTPYSLGIFVLKFYQMFVTVSTEFCLRFEPQVRPIGLAINFLFITAMAGRKVRLCVKLFDFFVVEYASVWPEICRILSQIQCTFLCGILGKNYFGRIFQKFLCKPRLSSTKTCEISPYFLKFYSGSVLRWKNSDKYFHMLFVPRLGDTSINKSQKEIRGRKVRRLCFRKTSFVHSRSGNTIAYSLGIFVWNIYQTVVSVSTVFWLRFEPQVPPTGLAINFLFITSRAEKKVRLCVKLFNFFCGWILIHLTWNFLRFVPNSV